MSNIGMKIAGIGGVLVVLGGGCAAAYAFSDTVKNQVKLRTSSPADYFDWVCERNIAVMADDSAASYQKVLDRTGGNGASSMSVYFTPTDVTKDLIRENTDPENELITDVVSNLGTIELRTDVVNSGSGVAEKFTLLVNDTEVTNAEAAVDASDGAIMMRIPDLSDRWIQMPAVNAEASMGLMLNPKEYLSASDCSELVSKYFSILPKHMNKNVTLEKKQPVQIGSLSTEYTAVISEMTADELVSIFTEITDTAANDEKLLSMVPEPDEFATAMIDAGDRVREAAEGAGSGTFSVTTYVDATGTIRGFYTAPESGTALFAAVGMDDGQYAAAVKCSAMDQNVLNFTAQSDASGNGNFKGSVIQSAEDSLNFSGTFSNLKTVSEKTGYVSGEISLSVEDSEPFKIVLSATDSEQNAECVVKIDDTEYGTVRATYRAQSDATVQEPDRSNAYVVDETYGFDITDYTDQDSLTQYVTTVLSRVGMSDENARTTAASLSALFFMF